MRTMVAIPCMDQIPTAFVRSLLGMTLVGDVEVVFASGSLVYDSRNKLSEQAIKGGFDRVLWLDSDMIFRSDLMERFMSRVDEGYEFVSGLYFKRRLPIEPVIYKYCDIKVIDGRQIPTADSYTDYPKDSFFKVQACGFGGVMTTVDLLKRITDRYGMPFFPVIGFGEDMSFCLKARNLGVPIMCDSSIKLGHIGITEITEQAYEIAGRKG